MYNPDKLYKIKTQNGEIVEIHEAMTVPIDKDGNEVKRFSAETITLLYGLNYTNRDMAKVILGKCPNILIATAICNNIVEWCENNPDIPYEMPLYGA